MLGASGTLWTGRLPVKHPTNTVRRKLREIFARLVWLITGSGSSQTPHSRAHENAPSRWRLRPASRLTAAEATADRGAINLGRSVLGASRTLGGVAVARQGVEKGTCRKLRYFLFTTAMLRLAFYALAARGEEKRPDPRVRPQEFAEPGTLSSTFPTNLPLPRSAPRGASSYRRPVLGAGRNLWLRTCPVKGVRRRKFSQIATPAV